MARQHYQRLSPGVVISAGRTPWSCGACKGANEGQDRHRQVGPASPRRAAHRRGTGRMSGATLAELQARLGHTTVAAAMRYQSVAADRDALIARHLSDLA